METYPFLLTINGRELKGSFTSRRVSELRATRSYGRYRRFLDKSKPYYKEKARIMLEEAYILVESYQGHKSATNAGGAWDAVLLIMAEEAGQVPT